ncbi:MAG: mechanosensitive ion channel family protein [Halanaerobiaceae bacterium]
MIEEILAYGRQMISMDMLYIYLTRIIGILVIIIITRLLIVYGFRIIDHLLIKREKKYLDRRRSETIQMLLKSVLRYCLYFFAVMSILSLLNFPVTSFLAGAGIVGVALGFGAQTLVKDIINGFFILFEDQFGVGDYIETADVQGVVKQVGLRTTSIESRGGEEHIIPNSEIRQVTNYSMDTIRVIVDIGVAYDARSEKVIEVLEKMCQEVAEEKGDIIEEGPTVLGVQELGDSSVSYRLWARVQPMQQWQLGRYLKKRSKEILTDAGIEIPYPHRVIISKKEEEV